VRNVFVAVLLIVQRRFQSVEVDAASRNRVRSALV
jgi:hypothetical protein